jgi:hypothetical protein
VSVLTPRDVIVASVADVADRFSWESRGGDADLHVHTAAGWQLWRLDAPWVKGSTCAVAVRAEPWVLQVPSVRVEVVEGMPLVLEGCRRFTVAMCDDEWHPVTNTQCPGHVTVQAPDPFPFERFAQAVLSGRVVCEYLDGLIDPDDAVERRWGGFVWLPEEDAQRLREFQGGLRHPLLEPVVEPAMRERLQHL